MATKDWFKNPIAVKICEEIEGARHVQDGVFINPHTGAFSYEHLSGGSKAMLLAVSGEVSDRILPLSWLGENCFKSLKHIPDDIDVEWYADYIPIGFLNFSKPFISRETGKLLKTVEDYRKEYIQYVYD